MTPIQRRQRIEAIAMSGGACEVCGKTLTNSSWQGAHRIANTRTNREKWGSWIIDHPMNIAIVCSLACNHVCNIGFRQGDCLRLVKKITDRELSRFGGEE